MNRRELLGVASGTIAAITAGCTNGGGDGGATTTRSDPFPDDVGAAKRGGAEAPVVATVAAGTDYEDGSIECAERGHDAVRARLDDEIELSEHISTGYGRGPEGYEDMAVSVHLTTERYDRDGELLSEADIAFEELVAVTPPSVYVETAAGDPICAVPVYVDKGKFYVD